MRTKLIYITLACIIATFVGTSCKTTETVARKKAKPIFIKKLASEIEENYLDYNTLFCKFDAEFQDTGKAKSFGGVLKIARDSMVWVSIRMAMVEIVRVSMTPDSVRIMVKPKNEYYPCTYDLFYDMFDIDMDYYSIQAMFSNELFSYPNSEDIVDLKKNFLLKVDSTAYILKNHKKREIKKSVKQTERTDKKEAKNPEKEDEDEEEDKDPRDPERMEKKIEKEEKKQAKKEDIEDLIAQSIVIDSETYKLLQVFIREYAAQRTVNVQYSDFEEIEGVDFPKTIDLEVQSVDEKLNLQMNLNKISINKTSKFPFKVPEKFKKMEFVNASE